MDRLTKQNYTFDMLNIMQGMTKYAEIDTIMNRIAAYENTGLTPEEINKIVSGSPVKVSFDIDDEGFLTAINGAFKERFGITADECSKTISDLQSERDTLKKALKLACDDIDTYGDSGKLGAFGLYVKQAQEGKDNAK